MTENERLLVLVNILVRRLLIVAVVVGVVLALPVLARMIVAPTRAAWAARDAGGQLRRFTYDGSAVARRVRITGARPSEAAEIRGAISYIRYPLSPSTFSIEVVDEAPPVPDAAGWYENPPSAIFMLRSVFQTQDRSEPAALVAHEIGHMVDSFYMTDVERQRFGALRHYPPGVSWQAPELPWARRPVEDFAEVFRVLTEPLAPQPVQTVYGPVADRAAIERILFARVPTFSDTIVTLWIEKVFLAAADQIEYLRDQTTVRWLSTAAAFAYIGWGMGLAALRMPPRYAPRHASLGGRTPAGRHAVAGVGAPAFGHMIPRASRAPPPGARATLLVVPGGTRQAPAAPPVPAAMLGYRGREKAERPAALLARVRPEWTTEGDAAMYARITRWKVPQDKIDDDVRMAPENTDRIAEMPGSLGVFYLVDRDGGRTIAMTLWDTEEHMLASESGADTLRQRSVDTVGATIVSVERYEVAYAPSEIHGKTMRAA